MYQRICSLLEIVEPVLPVGLQVASAISRTIIKHYKFNKKVNNMVTIRRQNIGVVESFFVFTSKLFKKLREMEIQ